MAEHGKGPLSGYRVVELTTAWAGPYAGQVLAHLGAESIRIESVNRLCVTRTIVPFAEGQRHYDRAGYFCEYNQGKRSVQLNLARPEAVELVKRLVAMSDAVIENFAAGVVERWGLGYEELKKVKPDIVMVSMSGHGRTGPLRNYVSYGPYLVALSGFATLTGYRGWEHPMHVGMSYPDPNGGWHGAFAVMAGLYYRKRTGRGQYVDLSQWEAAIALLGDAILGYLMNGHQPPRLGNRDPVMAPHGFFRCAPARDGELPEGLLPEDRWISIACGGIVLPGRPASVEEGPGAVLNGLAPLVQQVDLHHDDPPVGLASLALFGHRFGHGQRIPDEDRGAEVPLDAEQGKCRGPVKAGLHCEPTRDRIARLAVQDALVEHRLLGEDLVSV